jgi:hypothetical protein
MESIRAVAAPTDFHVSFYYSGQGHEQEAQAPKADFEGPTAERIPLEMKLWSGLKRNDTGIFDTRQKDGHGDG